MFTFLCFGDMAEHLWNIDDKKIINFLLVQDPLQCNRIAWSSYYSGLGDLSQLNLSALPKCLSIQTILHFCFCPVKVFSFISKMNKKTTESEHL